MNVKEQLVAQDVDVVRQVHGDGIEIVADFGPGATPSVDVVDNTVIVIDGGEQHEMAVDGDARAVTNNGVVTIEVDE